MSSQAGNRVGTAAAKRLAGTVGSDPYALLVAADNPLAYYRLNDAGATMVDSGPNLLNGVYGANVVHGATALTSSADQSSVFPGSAPGADVPSNSGTVTANALFSTPTTAFTIEAWIKPTDFNRFNNYQEIAAYGRGVIGNAWALQETPQSALDFYVKVNGGPGSYELNSGVTLNPAQIYQVAATYDGSSVKLYVNGNLATSVAATGSINYTGIAPQYGLAIGGSLGASRGVFNGAVNDVSIYPTALSAAELQKHALTGQIVQPVVETPTSSDAFVDSIGVVTHLRTSGSPYTNSWSTFQTLIESAGIRHIGDALIATPSFYTDHLNTLAAAGIHASLISDETQTAQSIAATIPAFATSIEAVEGPNEPDLSGDPNWVADTRTFQQMLWSTVKGNAATANLKVIGPSATSLANDLALGDLSAYMDSGSLHDYFSGYNPGTAGWGSLSQYGVYGSLQWGLNVSAIISGSKPLMVTETGYSADPTNSGYIDSRTLARYTPRSYLELFLHGIQRTTLYQFYDGAGNSSFDDFGLVDVNNTPRSSYYAIKSLIHSLADPGAAFTTKAVSYVLTGNMSNVHHLMLQKRDGTSELVIWVEAQSYNPTAKTDITVPVQTVTLQPTISPATASMVTIGDTGNLTTQALSFPAGIATLNIDDHVSIVTFK